MKRLTFEQGADPNLRQHHARNGPFFIGSDVGHNGVVDVVGWAKEQKWQKPFSTSRNPKERRS